MTFISLHFTIYNKLKFTLDIKPISHTSRFFQNTRFLSWDSSKITKYKELPWHYEGPVVVWLIFEVVDCLCSRLLLVSWARFGFYIALNSSLWSIKILRNNPATNRDTVDPSICSHVNIEYIKMDRTFLFECKLKIGHNISGAICRSNPLPFLLYVFDIANWPHPAAAIFSLAFLIGHNLSWSVLDCS